MSRQVTVIETARASTGTPTPMLRHIVKRNGEPAATPMADTALCGKPWDRFDVSAGPLCHSCKAEYRRLHPTWPFPGGAT